MASPQSKALDVLYKSWVDTMTQRADMSVDELRVMFDHWGDVTAEPGGVDYSEVDAGGVLAMWADPAGAAQDRVILCTHGGGYVVGSMYSHRKMFGHIAKAIGCRALILHYRRAPENPHPAQVEDATTAYRWLLDQGYDPSQIATTGDSAGGGLCTSVLLSIRDNGLPLPAAGMPLSPFYDMAVTGGTVQTNADVDVLVQGPILEAMAGMFLGGRPAEDPLASPLYADPSGLPPLLIQVGGHETLLDDSRRFAEKAKAAGVDVTVQEYPEMQHVFQFLAGVAPEADKAIAALATWVRPKLGLG